MIPAAGDEHIIVIGEFLWNSEPEGIFPGGAPFNVACLLQQLGRDVTFISRVGDDQLGTEALRRMAAAGLNTSMVQKDTYRPTGFIEVEPDSEGVPRYNIIKPAAWDYIELTSAVQQSIRNAGIVIFGTLAQRMQNSQRTILWAEYAGGKKILNLTLCEPFYTKDTLSQSLEIADVLKMNESESQILQQLYNLAPDLKKGLLMLSRQFDLETICVTRGAGGALLLHEGEWAELEGNILNGAETSETDDVFLAAITNGILRNCTAEQILEQAGAYLFSLIKTYH